MSAPHTPIHAGMMFLLLGTSAAFAPAGVARVHPRADTISMMEKIPKPDAGGFPFRSAVLGLVSVQSALGLAGGNEIGGVIAELSGQRALANDIDYFGTIVDALFLTYAASTLLAQTGLIKDDPEATAPKVSLNNMETEITLNIGREPGTWMPKDWAASGARLSLPMQVRFADELVDLGMPGEETLAMAPGGGRYAKKLYCEGGSFIAADGTTVVKASGGAWSAQPSGVPGACS